MILVRQALEVMRVRAVIEQGQNFADIIIALILQVGAYIEPVGSAVLRRRYRVLKPIEEIVLHALGVGAEIRARHERAREQERTDRRDRELRQRGDGVIYPERDEHQFRVIYNIDTVDVHAVRNYTDPYPGQQSEQRKPLVIGSPPLKKAEQTEYREGYSKKIHCAEAVHVVPRKVFHLQERDIQQAFEIGYKLLNGLIRKEQDIPRADAGGEVLDGDEGQLYRVPAEEVHGHGEDERPRDKQVHEGTDGRVAQRDALLYHIERADRNEEQRDGIDRDAVAVHTQAEKEHGYVQEALLLHQAAVEEIQPAHEEMRQKIAVERPAALKQVPRVYGDEQRRDEPGALAENIAHEEPEEHAPGDAAQQRRDAHGHDAQAEELHKRRDQI